VKFKLKIKKNFIIVSDFVERRRKILFSARDMARLRQL